MGVGSSCQGAQGSLAPLKVSRMNRVALGKLREKEQSGKASWKRAALEHGCSERSTSVGMPQG